MRLTGNVGALYSYARVLRRLSTVPSRMAADASQRISDLISDQFASESDPYGNAWAQHSAGTVKRWGEHSIMDLTGGLRGAVDVHPLGGAGIAVELNDVAAFHQTGTANMPARPILPYAGMPSAWTQALQDAAAEAFRATIGGG